jgi:hypothetical protein
MMIARRFPGLRTLLLVSIALSSGCAEKNQSRDDGDFEIDSAGGYPVVTTKGPAVRWQASPLVSIGATEGGAIEFGSIRSILLDSAGTLIVVDNRNRAVSEFDSTGTLVRQIGRLGGGPGEYREPYSVAWLNGNLALLDPANTRLGLFDRGGGWITSWTVQPLTGGQVIRLYRTPPGFYHFAYSRTATGARQFYVRYEANGPRDTVLQTPRPTDLEPGIECHRSDKAISFFTNPFAATFLQIPLGDGRVAVARSDAYRIAFLGPQGDTTMIIAGNVAASPISDADWATSHAEWEKFRREWPTAQCSRTSFNRPATKPVLNWLFLDGAGKLWAEVLTNEGTRYDVFDLDGHPVASVHGLPPSGGLDPSVTGTRAAFVVVDSTTDVQSVRVFRLAPVNR